LEHAGRPEIPWEAESLRLTAFTVEEVDLRGLNWWTELAGEEPETRVQNPRQHGLVEAGLYLDANLVLQVQPGRVDWVLQAHEAQNELTVDFQLLGPHAEWAGRFSDSMRRWFDKAPQIKRLAFGGVLIHPVAERDDAYREIMGLLPGLRLDSPDCSDFHYQINRPRFSNRIPDLRINRLVKWSAAGRGVAQFNMSSRSADLTTRLFTSGTRLEVDINTAPEQNREFLPAPLAPLWDEMVALGQEIAREGDIP
jgi:hypothetical protein